MPFIPWFFGRSCTADPYYSCGPTNDPYWANVVLMLHMDGTDGSTTFTDTSPAARTIAAFASAQIDTTNKKFGAGSGYFPTGTNSYLTTGDGYDMPGDFTVEFWLRFESVTRVGQVLFALTSPSSANHFYIAAITNGTSASIGATVGGASINSLTYDLIANTWYHIALVRSGSVVTLYKHGVSAGAVTTTFSPLSTRVGQVGYEVATGNSLYGYIDDLRITKGIARYTGNFNIPTAAFPDAETVLTDTDLFDPYFEDIAAFNRPPLLDGSTASFTDAGPTKSTIASINGASISTSISKFGASLVLIPTNDYWNHTGAKIINSASFTIEGWVRFNDISVTRTFISSYGPSFRLRLNGTTKQIFVDAFGASSVPISTTVVVADTWYHVAVVRRQSESRILLFINGTLEYSDVDATFGTAMTNSSWRFGSGDQSVDFVGHSGYLEEWRITRGIPRYSASFIAPTSRYPSNGGRTVLSLHADDGTVFAQKDPNTSNRVAVAYIILEDTAQSILALESAEASSVSSSISFPVITASVANELFVYSYSNIFANVGPATTMTISGGPTQTTEVSLVDNRLAAAYQYRTAGQTSAGVSGSSSATSHDQSAGVLRLATADGSALSVASTTVAEYVVNGSLPVSSAIMADSRPVISVVMHRNLEFVVPEGFSLLSRSRNAGTITNALAPVPIPQWVSVYIKRSVTTAPTVSDSSCYQPKTVTLAGEASLNIDAAKFGASSFAVPNVGTSTLNGVVINDHMDLDFGTGDFTIEMWAYRAANTYAGTLFYFTESAAFSLVVAATTGLVTLNYRSSGGTQASITTGVTFPLTTWQHVVVQRRGTNFEFYLHGVLGNTTAITGGESSTVNSAGAFYLGRTNASSALSWNGYIDETRVTKGVARYTAAFAVPTTAFPDSAPDDTYFSNVTFLTHSDGTEGSTTIIEVSAAKSITVFGNTSLSTTSPKFGTASISLDGTGDYATSPSSVDYDFGTADFTVETWINPTSIGTLRCIVGNRPVSSDRGWAIYIGGAGALAFTAWSASAVAITNPTGGSIPIGTWTHIAAQRKNGIFYLFVNGVSVAAAYSAVAIGASTSALTIGKDNAVVGRDFFGKIDDLRITKGIARYTSNFEPADLPNCDSV